MASAHSAVQNSLGLVAISQGSIAIRKWNVSEIREIVSIAHCCLDFLRLENKIEIS